MSTPYDLEIRRACDGDTLDQARAFEVCDKVNAEGDEGAQKLAQAVIARFTRYPEVPAKARLLELVDILVPNCDALQTQLAQEGFFQLLISDSKVQSDQPFRTTVREHLSMWLQTLSGKPSEIANDVLRRLSDTVKGEFPTDPQPGGSNPRGPSTQLLRRGPRDIIEFKTVKLEKQLCKFLVSSYIQAGDIVRTSRRVKWFAREAIHISRQAFHLIIRFNAFIGPDGPTDEQYDEGMDLDDALEELEDKIDELAVLEFDTALRDKDNHIYDLARLYQIFFSTRDFYPDGRNYKTDPVLKQLVASDLVTLNLARRLKAQGPRTAGFQIIDVDDEDEDDGGNQGHISDVSTPQEESNDGATARAVGSDPVPPPTEDQQASIFPPDSEGNVETVVLLEPQSQSTAEVTQVATTEGQQQEGATVDEEVGDHEETDEDTQRAIQRSLAAPGAVAARQPGDGDGDGDDGPPEKKFNCTVPGCNQSFSEHHELKAHIHEHDDKPYKCGIPGCDRAYPTQRDKDRHEAIHRLTRQFNLTGYGSPGKTTTTGTSTTGTTSGTQSQATQALPSIPISTSLPPSANPPQA